MGFEVEALSPGYYGTRRRKGDTFTVADEKDFSAAWMKKVETVKAEQPEQTEKPAAKVKKKTATKQK